MARLSKEILQGMIVPDPRLTLSNVDTTNSSYTEQSPRPGVPVPDDPKDTLRPIISGAQSVDVRAGIVRAGGVDEAEIAYRKGTEGSDDWRGWGSPSAPTWSDAIFYLSGYVAAAHDCTTDPNTQAVLTAHLSYTAANYKVYLTHWNAHTWASTTTEIGESSGTFVTTPASCCSVRVQPSGRIVVFYGESSSYSDDNGSTFASFAEGAWDAVTTSPQAHTRMRVFEVGGQLCAITLVSNDDVQQYASNDGTVWTQVQAATQTLGLQYDVTEMPDGSAWVIYRDASYNVKAFRMTSAYQLVSSLTAGAETVVAGGVADEDVAIAADPDGRLFAFLNDSYTVPSYRRIDGTWTAYATGTLDAQSDYVMFSRMAATCSMGSVMLVTDAQNDQATGQNDQIRATMCGGWSTLVADHRGNRQDSPGFNDDGAIHWQALAIPDADGGTAPWTSSGTAGGTVTIDGDGLRIQGANQMYKWTMPDDQLAFVAQWQMVATNPMMETGYQPRPGLLINSVYSGGSTMYELRVLFRSTTVLVYCMSCGGVVLTATIDTSVDRIYHLQVDATGDVELMHRLPGETVWTEGGTGTVSTKADSGSSFIQWGHYSSGAGQDSTWKWVQARKVEDVGSTQLQWVRGQASLVGRPLGSLGSPVPVIGTTSQAAYLHAEGGSAPDQAPYTIDASHDYPIEAILPAVQPSPAIGWRSTSTAEQLIVWDLGSATTTKTYLGKALGLYLSGCNFQTCALEYSDNGASWTTAGTLDLSTGYSALDYTLTGDAVVVRSGTGEGADYIYGEELIGCHALLDGKSRQIVGNLSGQWGETGTTTRPALRLDTVDGSETAAGTAKINMKSGALIVFGSSLVTARYWRLKIAASQAIDDVSASDPESGYRIGSAVLGEFMAFGSGTGSGWTETTSPNYTETISRRGTRVRKSYGPIGRRWSLVWDEADRFLDSEDPNYVANDDSDLPLAAAGEVYEQLRALARRVDALAVPVVAVRYTPAASGGNVITTPSAVLYGHISGEVELQQVSGDNDHSGQQVIRAGALQVDEAI